jgi:hypothetical protein
MLKIKGFLQWFVMGTSFYRRPYAGVKNQFIKNNPRRNGCGKTPLRAVGSGIFLDHLSPLPYEKGVPARSVPVPGGVLAADVVTDRGARWLPGNPG